MYRELQRAEELDDLTCMEKLKVTTIISENNACPQVESQSGYLRNTGHRSKSLTMCDYAQRLQKGVY
jgi:hypothetical protein